MKSWLLHNLGLKILSLVLGALVWWLIQAETADKTHSGVRPPSVPALKANELE